MIGVDPSSVVVGWNRVDCIGWIGILGLSCEGRSGGRRRLSSCFRNDISFTKAASLCFNWSNSDRNSRRISEIIAIGDASVFLLVAILEPPREISSGMDTMSTLGGMRGSLTEGTGAFYLR